MKRGNVFATIDWLTILIYILMIFMGWFNIFSAVYSEEHPNILDFNQRYGKQFIWIIAALIIGVIFLIIDFKFYEFFAYVFYIIAILLLLGVLIVGKEINGAKSWFMIGGFQIQPSEFAKPAVAIALAKYLSGFNLKINSLKTYLITAAIIFIPFILILLQPDTGSSLVFFAFLLPIYREGFPVSILMVLAAFGILFLMVLLFEKFIILLLIAVISLLVWAIITKSIKNFIRPAAVLLLSLGIVYGLSYLFKPGVSKSVVVLISFLISGLIFLFHIIKHRLRAGLFILLAAIISTMYIFSVDYAFDNILDDYQQRRINIMLGFESDPKGAGYNLNQSKIAIGSGGFSGKGFLNGTQTKLDFVPEQSTDFIFCTVGEEWGFLGSLVVLGLFSIFLIRLVQLAERQRSKFARIFGYGVVSVFFFHYFVNIAMTIGLFPVVGIPLPFFSYGGSSLWAFTILLFIFLRLDASRMEHIN